MQRLSRGPSWSRCRAGSTAAIVALAMVVAGAAGCAGTPGPAGSTAATTAASASSRTPGTSPATVPARTPAPCDPARPAPAGETVRTVGAAPQGRPYRMQVPAAYDGTHPVPVIVDLHGAASNKEQEVAYSQLARRGTERGYAVVVPDGSSVLGWNFFRAADQPDDVAVLHALLDEITSTLCVDPERIYAAGISAGAAFADVLACQPGERLAAVAFVAATLPPQDCAPGRRLPVIAFHGTDDPIVPYRGGSVNALAARGVAAPPAEEAASSWARQDGCDPVPHEDQAAPDARRWTFGGCPPGVAVELYTLRGAGHTWPGSPVDLAALGFGVFGATNRTIDATGLILDFFDGHQRVA